MTRRSGSIREDAYAYRHRGVVFYDKNKYDRTIADENQAIELRPDFAEAYFDRGRAHYQLDNHQEALADFSAAIRSNGSARSPSPGAPSSTTTARTMTWRWRTTTRPSASLPGC